MGKNWSIEGREFFPSLLTFLSFLTGTFLVSGYLRGLIYEVQTDNITWKAEKGLCSKNRGRGWRGK